MKQPLWQILFLSELCNLSCKVVFSLLDTLALVITNIAGNLDRAAKLLCNTSSVLLHNPPFPTGEGLKNTASFEAVFNILIKY